MSRLPFENVQNISSKEMHKIGDGGARWFESDPSYPTIIDWQRFHNFLLQRMTAKTAEDRYRYSKQFYNILQNGDASTLMQLPANKRIHVQKALSCLARYTGKTEQWSQLRKTYGLTWTTGNEQLDAFSRFFSEDNIDLEKMIEWLREARQRIPKIYSDFYLFCTLTGMRCSEALASVKLIKDPETFKRY